MEHTFNDLLHLKETVSIFWLHYTHSIQFIQICMKCLLYALYSASHGTMPEYSFQALQSSREAGTQINYNSFERFPFQKKYKPDPRIA